MPAVVVVQAVGVGIAGVIEPVSGALFAKRGPREEVVNQPLVGIGRVVADERLDLLWSGKQACEVESHSPNQRWLVGFGRWRKARLIEVRENEVVDGIARPIGVRFCLGN